MNWLFVHAPWLYAPWFLRLGEVVLWGALSSVLVAALVGLWRRIAKIRGGASAISARRLSIACILAWSGASVPLVCRPSNCDRFPYPEIFTLSAILGCGHLAISLLRYGTDILDEAMLKRGAKAESRERSFSETLDSIRSCYEGCPKVEILVSEEADGFCAAGVFRKIIIVPRRTRASDGILRTILAHEIGHHVNGDPLRLHWEVFFRSLLYQPGLFWLRKWLDHAREIAADHFAEKVGATPSDLAAALEFATNMPPAPPEEGIVARLRILLRMPSIIQIKLIRTLGSWKSKSARNGDGGSKWRERLLWVSAGFAAMIVACLVYPWMPIVTIVSPSADDMALRNPVVISFKVRPSVGSDDEPVVFVQPWTQVFFSQTLHSKKKPPVRTRKDWTEEWDAMIELGDKKGNDSGRSYTVMAVLIPKDHVKQSDKLKLDGFPADWPKSSLRRVFLSGN